MPRQFGGHRVGRGLLDWRPSQVEVVIFLFRRGKRANKYKGKLTYSHEQTVFPSPVCTSFNLRMGEQT